MKTITNGLQLSFAAAVRSYQVRLDKNQFPLPIMLAGWFRLFICTFFYPPHQTLTQNSLIYNNFQPTCTTVISIVRVSWCTRAHKTTHSVCAQPPIILGYAIVVSIRCIRSRLKIIIITATTITIITATTITIITATTIKIITATTITIITATTITIITATIITTTTTIIIITTTMIIII